MTESKSNNMQIGKATHNLFVFIYLKRCNMHDAHIKSQHKKAEHIMLKNI